MYELADNAVMTVTEVWTKTQTATVKEFYCYVSKVLIGADKATITVNGTDKATISCRWQKFNLDTGEFEDDLEKTDTFIIDINGTIYEVTDKTIEFTSSEPGTYKFTAINECVEQTEVEVTAQ